MLLYFVNTIDKMYYYNDSMLEQNAMANDGQELSVIYILSHFIVGKDILFAI